MITTLWATQNDEKEGRLVLNLVVTHSGEGCRHLLYEVGVYPPRGGYAPAFSVNVEEEGFSRAKSFFDRHRKRCLVWQDPVLVIEDAVLQTA